MKSLEVVVSLAQRTEQALGTMLFVATVFVVGGGLVAVCVPDVLGFV